MKYYEWIREIKISLEQLKDENEFNDWYCNITNLFHLAYNREVLRSRFLQTLDNITDEYIESWEEYNSNSLNEEPDKLILTCNINNEQYDGIKLHGEYYRIYSVFYPEWRKNIIKQIVYKKIQK